MLPLCNVAPQIEIELYLLVTGLFDHNPKLNTSLVLGHLVQSLKGLGAWSFGICSFDARLFDIWSLDNR